MKFKFLLIPLFLAASLSPVAAAEKPNFIVILADDLGYNDLGCFGSPDIRTPNLDKMAAEGIKFTDFYAASAVCTHSRAGFLTGCYPKRVGFGEEIKRQTSPRGAKASPRSNTLRPLSNFGLNPQETIIPEVLKEGGYKSAIVGKWHLGDAPEFTPIRQGFDYYFGVPYSNDMRPLYFMHNEDRWLDIIPNQNELTTTYTEHAKKFISENKNNPFFLYLAHNMPHTPLTPGKNFLGKSQRGLYGDAVEEVDWSVGEIIKTLKDYDLDKKTYVRFFSDNGPWLIRGDEGGSAFPLRNGKASSYEGGFRVPCIVWGGGNLTGSPGRVSREIVTAMDFLPTFASLAGLDHTPEHPIDGVDVSALIKGEPGAKSPRKTFLYYFGPELHAVREGKWKYRAANILLNESIYRRDEHTSVPIPEALYNLENDLGEQKSVAEQFPKKVAHLKNLLDEARQTLGDSMTNSPGTQVRELGNSPNMFDIIDPRDKQNQNNSAPARKNNRKQVNE